MKKQKPTANWDREIIELEEFFKRKSIPKDIRLNSVTRIWDSELFISSHMQIVKSNNGNRIYRPYLDRLIEFKRAIQ